MSPTQLHTSMIKFLLTILISVVVGRPGVWLKGFQHCDASIDYDAKYNINITEKGNKQYIDGMLVLKSPCDNNIASNITVEILVGNSYVHLLSITERKSCDALHKYFGEFLYDLERQAQLIPGMCPIPKGRYQIHNGLLDFQKMTTLGNFPFGNLHFKDVAHKKDNTIYTCLELEIENHGYF